MDNLTSKFITICRNPGLGKRPLGGMIGVSYNTAARYRSLIEAYNLDEAEIARLGDSGLAALIRQPPGKEAEEPALDSALIDLQSGLSRRQVYDKFMTTTDARATISYRTFCVRIAARLADREPLMRLVHAPGAAVMVDFAGYRPPMLNHARERVNAELFVGVLPASGYTFACAVASQSTADWIWANVQMLEFYGGVPRKIICDNLKAAVIACPRREAPRLNPIFASFCAHYGLVTAPARVRRPRDKGSVEAHVKIVQRRLAHALANLPLPTLAELNRVVSGVIDEINATVIRRLVSERRRDLFDTYERAELAPLPAHRFEHFEEFRVRKLRPDYHVEHGKVAYSVPCELIGRPVMVRAFHDRVEIWHDGHQVACHPRIHKPGHIETIDRHRPEGHRKWADRKEDDLLAWANSFGSAVQEVARAEAARGLHGAAGRNQYGAITRLPREFGRETFEQACAIAVERGRPRLGVVRNLLENARHTGHVSRRVRKQPSTKANVRGPDYYSDLGRGA